MSVSKPGPRAAFGLAMLVCAVLPTTADARGALTTDQARQAIEVIEDPLDAEVTLSTRSVARSTRGVIRTPHNDGHLQASIHRGTGQVRFEVRQTFNYDGPYRGYRQVNYEAGALPKTSGVTLVETNEEHCQSFDSGTACLETVVFDIPEADLAGAVTTGGRDPTAWELKFKPELGREHRSSISHAEIDGLLQAVAAYRASLIVAAPAFPGGTAVGAH